MNYYVMFVFSYNIGFSVITYVIPVCIIFIAHFQICSKLRAIQQAFESKSINSAKKEIRNSEFNDVLTREPPPNNSNKNAADPNGSYMIIVRHAKDINGLRLSNIVISKRKVSL